MVLTEQKLAQAIKNIGRTVHVFRERVQAVLPSIAYQAMRGNPNWANDLLLSIGEEGKSAAHLEGIVRWCETFAPLRFKDGKFLINKATAKQFAVNCEEDFAPYEAEMAEAKWWLLSAKQRPPSLFDAGTFIPAQFAGMAKKLNSNGFPELAAEVSGLLQMLYHTNVWKAAVVAKYEEPAAEEPAATEEPPAATKVVRRARKNPPAQKAVEAPAATEEPELLAA